MSTCVANVSRGEGGKEGQNGIAADWPINIGRHGLTHLSIFIGAANINVQ